MGRIEWRSKVNVKYRDLWAAQDGKCFYCHEPMIVEASKASHPKLATRDHFVPAAHRATRENNVVLACRACNTASNHRMPSMQDLRRFIALYSAVGRSYEAVRDRVRKWHESGSSPSVRDDTLNTGKR